MQILSGKIKDGMEGVTSTYPFLTDSNKRGIEMAKETLPSRPSPDKICGIRNCDETSPFGVICSKHSQIFANAVASLTTPEQSAAEPKKRRYSFRRENKSLYVTAEMTRLRLLLIDIYGEICMACGSTEQIVLEHIKSRYIGGTNDTDNLQLLCRDCNFRKGHTVVDYRPKLECGRTLRR